MEPVFRALEITAKTLVKAQGLRLTFLDLDNLPATGGVVLAINHTGYLDFLPAALGVYHRGRRVRFMIKAEMQQIAIMRFLIKHTRTVPVDRSAGAQAYELAVQALRDGEVVGVYPEATISRSFEIKTFKSGVARMAMDAKVPIVPVIVWGAQRIATKGGPRNLGRSRIPIIVQFGEPISPGGGEALEARKLADHLRVTMQEMLIGVQQRYDDQPAGAYWVPARLGGGAPTLAEADVLDQADAAARRQKRQDG
jgi:1-acyl-sn-glycerol-3-phosphate acyltransferase